MSEFEDEGYFAETFGYDCVDGGGEAESTPQEELARRVGKPHLWEADAEGWEEADLYDFVEVMHDLAARPTRSYYHSYSQCGWHPVRFSPRSGQRLYCWRMNQVLDGTALGLRLADSGSDAGRLVRAQSTGLAVLIDDVLHREGAFGSAVAIEHAIGLFRARSATRGARRSAVVELAGVLESRRALLKEHLLSKDESALFQIANNFDIRHRDGAQSSDYDDAFLDWIFAWYLATVDLTDRLLSRDD